MPCLRSQSTSGSYLGFISLRNSKGNSGGNQGYLTFAITMGSSLAAYKSIPEDPSVIYLELVNQRNVIFLY